MPPDKHFDGRRFFNPAGTDGQPIWKAPRLLMARRTPWPDSVPVRPQPPPPLGNAPAVVTFIGHSTFVIQTATGNILTDPVYAQRAGPLRLLGPRRVRQPGVPFGDLPEISAVILSHNHYDHCDLRALQALDTRFHPVVITPLKNGPLLKSAGIRRIEELDWWQQGSTAPMGITLTPARHFSARTPFDRNRALWGGFLISGGGRLIFFAGDSGYGPHFAEIRSRSGPVDLALLPIGAYEPRWFMQDVHMNPAEAVQAHDDLGARQSIGMHFGTFHLTTEGISEPVAALDAALRARGIPATAFRTLEPGESLRLE
jgi:L-ascorbate metabolism protein UlaG (beta-lactamase superfamily)